MNNPCDICKDPTRIQRTVRHIPTGEETVLYFCGVAHMNKAIQLLGDEYEWAGGVIATIIPACDETIE